MTDATQVRNRSHASPGGPSVRAVRDQASTGPTTAARLDADPTSGPTSAVDATPAASPPLPCWLIAPGSAAAVGAIWLWLAWMHSHPAGLGSPLDLQVYYDGGTALRTGTHLYTANYTHVHLPFTYPPFSAMVFAAASYLRFVHVQLVMTAGSVLAVFGTAWLCLGRLGHRASPGRLGATLLLGSAALWTEPVQQTLAFGQVNAWLMLIVVADLCLPDRFWCKGFGVGIAAGFKLVPAIFILYLLLTRRRRATGVSVGTLLITVAGSFAVFPAEAREYWGGMFFDSTRVGNVSYLGNQSLHGLIDRTLHGGSAVQGVWFLATAVVALAGLLLAARQQRQGNEVFAILITGTVGLLASPISWSHHWVWALPAIVVAADWAWRRTTSPFRALAPLAPLGLTLLFAAWPQYQGPALGTLPSGIIWWASHGATGTEYRWQGLQILQGELYTLTALAFIAGVAFHTLRQRRTLQARQEL